MKRIKTELTEETPNLSGLGISPTVLERYRVCEAHTTIGRRIAVPYTSDCTKLLAFDGSAVWDGDYIPGAGLFGQQEATSRTLILCAHEFEALRVATVLEDGPDLCDAHPVALPSVTDIGLLGYRILIDALSVVADEVWVWNATVFNSISPALERLIVSIDEANTKVKVKALALGRMHSPLDLDTNAIKKVLKGAKVKWSPSNLVTAQEIFESEKFFASSIGVGSGIEGLDAFIKGYRKSELVMYVAGTGVGKSTILRQQIYHLAYKEGQRCLLAFFEETRSETLKKLACIHYQITFETLQRDPHALTDKQWKDFLALPATKSLRFLSQSEMGFGGIDVDTLLGTVRYLKRKEHIDFVAVDHISIMISGRESSKEGERKDIDIMMTKMAMACVTLEVGILAICHLSNPEGKPHEEGGRVFLSHMRGSGALKQLAWCVIAGERDQQSSDSSLVLIRVLKNRNGGGRTGLATVLEFCDPLLIERKDMDLLELAANVNKASNKGKGNGPVRKSETHPRANPFGGGGKKRARFGKLEDKE